MLNILIMISNYFHDLATAIMTSNILVVYFFGKYLDKIEYKEQKLSAVFNKLKYVTYGTLIYIIIFGAVRAYFFMDFEWNPAVGKGQISALIIKHIFLFTLTGFGIFGHLKYQRKYGTEK